MNQTPKKEIQISTRIKDIFEICQMYKKYQPESSEGWFMKYILNGLVNRLVFLFVYYNDKDEFKGGVVCTWQSDNILWIDFAYVDQKIKGLSKKFMVAVLKIAQKLGIKDIQTKAIHHFVGAEKKFGFTEAYRVISLKVPEEKEVKEIPKVEVKKEEVKKEA